MMRKIIYLGIALIFLVGCNSQKTLSELVTVGSAWKHLEALDKIGKENTNRAVGTPGGIASKEYIVDVLKKLGLSPVTQDFTNRAGAQGSNVIVEIPGRNSDAVIMIGAHYDSVIFGPGINDNASGVAVLLEIISSIQDSSITPEKTLRFAFWDSEETGVEGSPAYYNSLSDADRSQIEAYINVDMVATIGGEVQISDTDGSTVQAILDEAITNGVEEESIEMLRAFYGAMKFAQGSEKLEELTKEIFTQLNVDIVEDLTFAMNSDTGPFFATIPTIGITVTKMSTEASEDGGEIVNFAPCYHQACDDLSNIDKSVLESCLKAVSGFVQKMAIEVPIQEIEAK